MYVVLSFSSLSPRRILTISLPAPVHFLADYGPSEFIEGEDTTLSNFAQACAPNSPLRRSERGEHVPDYSDTSGVRSFIWNHAKVSDLCQHPESRKLHGHTMQQGVPLGPLVPLFTFAKTRLHADILSTPIEQWEAHYPGYEPAWEGKSQNKLLWRGAFLSFPSVFPRPCSPSHLSSLLSILARLLVHALHCPFNRSLPSLSPPGSTTGVEFDRHTPWRKSQRARLHIMSHDTEGEKPVIWAQRGQMKETNMSVSTLNQLYMDTSFSGALQQCDPETCELMTKTMVFKPTIGLDESNTVRFPPFSPVLSLLLTPYSPNSTSTSSTSTETDGLAVSIVSCRPAPSFSSSSSSPLFSQPPSFPRNRS